MIFTYKKILKKIASIQSIFTFFIFLLLYTACIYVFFAPPKNSLTRCTSTYTFSSTDLYDPIKSSIKNAILEAKTSICLIIYSLSDQSIVHALQESAAKGIHVEVLYDQVESPYIEHQLTSPIHTYPCRDKGLMHMKMLVIDHQYVWLGSANLSYKSLTSQGNITTIFCNPSLAKTIEELASCMREQKYFSSPPNAFQNETQTLSVYFHPYHNSASLNLLLRKIAAAKNRIVIAMFTFTHQDIAKALIAAYKRGVLVKVLMDKDAMKQTCKKIVSMLRKEKIPCGYRKKNGLLHYKTALIDDSFIFGSCNWTKAAFTVNHETFLCLSPLSKNQNDWLERWWKTIENQSTLRT